MGIAKVKANAVCVGDIILHRDSRCNYRVESITYNEATNMYGFRHSPNEKGEMTAYDGYSADIFVTIER